MILELPKRKYYLLRNSDFEINLGRYISFKEQTKKNEETINKLIYERMFPLKSTGNTYRVINHWMSKGLIDDNRENKNGRRKFNLRELVRIKLISKLREFDFSINKIFKVKEDIFRCDDVFELYLTRAYFQKEEIKVIIFENGETEFVSEQELEITRPFIRTDNYLQISFTGILEEVINKKLERKEVNIMPLNDREKTLFSQMYDKSNKDFQIKTENGRIKKFKQITNNKEKLKNIKNINLRELVENNKNSKIHIYTNDKGKITSIELEK